MKLSDYVAQTLVESGIDRCFMVTGGAAMHLNDSLGFQQGLSVVCHHHEQAAAMAAEGYARVTNRPAVVSVTAGPGGINALNGVFGAWTDSIPMVIISGQVKRETLVSSYEGCGLRQLGDQEVDIVSMARSITKYAILVRDPHTIRYHLLRAVHLATSGRQGPVWLDIPIDVQASQVEPEQLKAYNPGLDQRPVDMALLRLQCTNVLERIQKSPRPVLLGGSGVRLAGAVELFQRVVEKLQIPVTTAWTHDLIASDSPYFCGRPGSIGERAGNFTVQNSETLLTIGSRLNIRQTSYNYPAFARGAFKIQVDIDPAELEKPTVWPDFPIVADAKAFLEELDRQISSSGYDPVAHAAWLRWCRERRQKYPVVQEKHRTGKMINPYHFIDTLFRALDSTDVVACGDATACIVSFQTAHLKSGTRMFSNSGSASMGYDLPAAIGACTARPGQRVICLAGDGSIQLNIQELATVSAHRWPIKVFVLCNGGYVSIRNTQSNFFKRVVGCGPESGVTFPDFVALAKAYGIEAFPIDDKPFAGKIQRALSLPGPVLVAVNLDPSQTFEPRLSSRQLPDGRMVTTPPEDMFPFLNRAEFQSNMVIPVDEA